MISGAVEAAAFPDGDCRDASLGTMLRLAGLDHPESLLCGELNFVCGRAPGGFRDTVILLRAADAATRAEEACGPRVEVREMPDRDAFLGWVEEHAAPNAPVAVAVDHWEYEASQFFRSGHMPHHLLVTGAREGTYTIFDPYAYSRFGGEVDRSRLLRWTDSAELGEYRFRVFRLAGGAADPARMRSHLAGTWRSTLRSNAAAMLDGALPDDARALAARTTGGTPVVGVRAIELVADRIAEWVEGEGFAADAARRRKMPTTSFLEAGAVRRGHALWLRRVAELGFPCLEAAAEFHAVGRQWDVVSSVRHAYQESGGAEPPRAFLVRKLAQMPRLIRLIAQAERRATERAAEGAR